MVAGRRRKGKQEVGAVGLRYSLYSFQVSYCCINPQEVRDYGKPERGYYGGAQASDQTDPTRDTAGHSEFAHLTATQMKKRTFY